MSFMRRCHLRCLEVPPNEASMVFGRQCISRQRRDHRLCRENPPIAANADKPDMALHRWEFILQHRLFLMMNCRDAVKTR